VTSRVEGASAVCGFSRGTDNRQMEGKISVCDVERHGEDFLDPGHVLFLLFYLPWIFVENRLKVTRKCVVRYKHWI